MHGTRTTAKVLVGVAVAVLSGCVSVVTPPPASEPPRDSGMPAQDVAPQTVQGPQIVEGPAREALEAALPAPGPPGPRTTDAAAAGPRKRPGGSSRGQDDGRPSSPPRQKRDRQAAEPPAPPEPPRSREEVCDLGERFGGWRPGSDEARACRGTYRP
ncbi:hypothetical protein [Streptomyces sp. NPDC053755]|uniref:hypothetical protein n=1 Tax=Streptomyces sp. NPDC053755 TaxID=3155815 RepID=UPI00342D369F